MCKNVDTKTSLLLPAHPPHLPLAQDQSWILCFIFECSSSTLLSPHGFSLVYILSRAVTQDQYGMLCLIFECSSSTLWSPHVFSLVHILPRASTHQEGGSCRPIPSHQAKYYNSSRLLKHSLEEEDVSVGKRGVKESVSNCFI